MWTGAESSVGIEVKATPRWRSEHCAVSRELLQQGAIRHGVVVYLGEHALVDVGVEVLPASQRAASLSDFVR